MGQTGVLQWVGGAAGRLGARQGSRHVSGSGTSTANKWAAPSVDGIDYRTATVTGEPVKRRRELDRTGYGADEAADEGRGGGVDGKSGDPWCCEVSIVNSFYWR